jgi:hypothetical protein
VADTIFIRTGARRSSGPFLAAVLVVGLGVGILTSFGQSVLDRPWAALANSASAWLLPAFLVGVLAPSVRRGALGGLACCLLELVGYYVTAEARGFPAGGAIVAFWVGCAVLGGPLFGAAGRVWRAGPPVWWPASAALPTAAFAAEGVYVHLLDLGYRSTGILWLAIAAVLALALGRTFDGWIRIAVALVVLLPLGLAGEAVLATVYARGFG